MPRQRGAQPTQLGLNGTAPAEAWLSMERALEAFRDAGADEVMLMVRVNSEAVRYRLSDHGYEFHPLDVDRWARIEGAIANGQQRRRRTDSTAISVGNGTTPSGSR